jgi:two-component system NtrC family response regulator
MTPEHDRERILLVEDDDSLREVLAMNLEDFGYLVDQVHDGASAIERYDPGVHALVLTDLRMPGAIGGLEVLDHVTSVDPGALVLVLTAFGGAKRSLEAMRRGAFHYVEKPVNTTSLIHEIERALARRGDGQRARETRGARAGMIASSPAMNEVLRVVDKVASSDAPVMILGESGVGKELVARALHERSSRRAGAFVAVNCAAIPRDLLESILFGYEKGAFTGAHQRTDGKFTLAHGGTLFLDEIAEMSLDLQSKLLRVLQDGSVERVGSPTPEHVDVRVVTATHQDVGARVEEGAFREDLFYRLHVIPIRVPPLRERPEDIPVLVRHFLRELSPQAPLEVDPEVDARLMRYAWPGNVRELRNVIERMVLLRDADRLTPDDVPRELTRGHDGREATGELPFALPADGLDLMALERGIIVATLRLMGGNQSAAARYLNIPRHVLVYRLEKFEIDPDEYADPSG